MLTPELKFFIRCSTLANMQVTALATVIAVASLAIDPASAQKLPKGDGAPAAPKPAASSASTAPGRPSFGQGYYRMKLVKIIDNEGFGPNVEVAHLLLPADWRTEGGVHWVNGQLQCPQNMIQVQFKATAPDGVAGIEIGPSHTWQWSSDPQMQRIIQQQAAAKTACDAGPVLGAIDYLRSIIPRMRPGARILAAEPLPALTAAKQEEAARDNAMLIKAGVVRAVKAESGSVRIAYTQNGQSVEEWISTTVQTVAKPTADSAALMRGQMINSQNYYSMFAEGVFAARAPAGKLDKKLIATVVASERVNAQYQAAVSQFLVNMGNTQLKGVMDRQRIWHDAQQQISATIIATYQHQQAVQDRLAEQWSQTIRGVETYVNPSTGTNVELTGGYDSAWVNNRGEYLLSDSPGFNPAVAFQEGWTQLKKAK